MSADLNNYYAAGADEDAKAFHVVVDGMKVHIFNLHAPHSSTITAVTNDKVVGVVNSPVRMRPVRNQGWGAGYMFSLVPYLQTEAPDWSYLLCTFIIQR